MKKLIILALAAVMLLMTMFAGCVRVNLAEKNGPITTKNYNYTDFTGIDIGHAFELVVTPSANFAVSITAGNNVLEHINLHKDGSTLVFELEGWTDIWFSSWYISPKVNITMPVLNELRLSGAAKAKAHGFKSSNDLNLQLSGASGLDIDMQIGDLTSELSGASAINGNLLAADGDIKLSGASHIDLTGSGKNIKLHGSGASEADMKGFAVNNADIDFSGASHVSLVINGKMDVSLSGASSLEYSGNPRLGNIDITGASSMNEATTP